MRYSLENIEKQVLTFTNNNVPFLFCGTNQSIEIFSDNGYYRNKESEFPPHELNFIKRVKNYVLKHRLYEIIPNRFYTPDSKKQIKYYSYNINKKPGDIIINSDEIDLTMAYWETSYIYGLMSDDIYEDGKHVSKKARLAAIGTLAKKIKRFYFDGYKQHELPPLIDLRTEYLWDTICDHVGRVMMRAADACKTKTKDDFGFFWVDAMFANKSSTQTIVNVFAEEGYKCTIEKCSYIEFRQKDIIVKGKGHWVEVGGDKTWTTRRKFPYKATDLTTNKIINLSTNQ